MSETVEIENLNLSATEEDVRRLCQMFGPVQVRRRRKIQYFLFILVKITGSLSETSRGKSRRQIRVTQRSKQFFL